MGFDPIRLIALGAAASCVALALVLIFRRHPQWSIALWVGALFFTPVWLGVSVFGIYVTALTAVTIVAIVSGIGRGLTWSVIDTVMVVLLLTLVLAYAIGGSVSGHLQESLLVWFLPYLWGRIVLSRVSENWLATCIAVAAVVASILAIIEFVTGDNIFLSIPGASSSVWNEQRERAGLLRVEGAFGHSIALGATLAMASSFLMSVRWPVWMRTVALVLIGIATALTFSRLGIVGFVLTVLLACIFLRVYVGRRLRIVALTALTVGAALALPILLQVFGEAGAEAEGSAGYRVDLLPLIGTMLPLGVSPAREVLPTGEDYWGGFRSIDSALILIGLRFGLVPLAIVVLLIVFLLLSVLRGRGTPASVALAAQIPAFATVALITQYAVFVWFAAGVAVTSYSLAGARATGDRRYERAGDDRDMVGVR